jgi:hypothetical protein
MQRLDQDGYKSANTRQDRQAMSAKPVHGRIISENDKIRMSNVEGHPNAPMTKFMRALGHSSFERRHCLTSKKQRHHEQSIRTEILNLTALSSHVSNGLA